MKKLLTLTLVMVFVLGLIGGVALADEPCERYGQGYWKQWLAENPDYECPYGIPTEYLLALLNTPARGDANVILSYQFIAAALNVNVHECILPEGTGCDGNDVETAFWAAFDHLVIKGGDSGATSQDILGWKDILECWNENE